MLAPNFQTKTTLIMLTPVQSVVKERNQLKRRTFDIGYHARQLLHMFSINWFVRIVASSSIVDIWIHHKVCFCTCSEPHISKLAILIQLSRESVHIKGKRCRDNFWIFLVEVLPVNRSERSQNSLSRWCVNCGCQSQHHKLTETWGIYLGGGQITETCKHLTSKP